ncbi:MAG: NAD-dependent epimerase/dehydratase family protein [Acidimicrobiaceae bacterium]|nr:NAD-dependent epimerase/dehydratase family protein [Acidimicrobiaceae bacterium]
MELGHVVVTGGAGFIGSHLLTLALENSKSVTVVDLRPQSHPNANHLVLDISDKDSLFSNLPRQIDTIFHLAARTSVLQSINDPQGVFETNVVGTQNLLEVARQRGAGRILLASTNAVVGNLPTGKITETAPLRPLTPYGSTKAAAEVLANAYSACYGIKSTHLRLTNVYGEGMAKKDSIVPRLMRTALGLSTFSIYGDGEQFRDYVYVKDVAKAFIQLAGTDYQGPVVIGSAISVSVNALIEKVSKAAGVRIEFDRVSAKPGEMRGVSVDNTLSISLGVTIDTHLDEGLARTWNDFKSNQEIRNS